MSSAEIESRAIAAGGNYHGTHLPILLGAVRRTTGPVIELGSGDSSTPALHEECAKGKRLLVTVDNNAKWLDKFKHMESDTHILDLCAEPSNSAYMLLKPWSVAFVDQAPALSRKLAVKLLADSADYIVIHDSEDPAYDIEVTLEAFKYRRDFKCHGPWTTIVSNLCPIWHDL